MLVTNRFVVASDADAFVARAHAALAALAGHPGTWRRAGPPLDDPPLVPGHRWEKVGALPAGTGGFDVKVNATPLLAGPLDEPVGLRGLAGAAPGGAISVVARTGPVRR